MQILQENGTHAEGVLQTNQGKWSDDHRSREAIQSQRSNRGEECGRHHSLRLSGFKLCLGRAVVPSTVPHISDVHTTPQLINNIRNDVPDQIKYRINALHSRPFITCKIENVLNVRALYDTGADVNCMSAIAFNKLPLKKRPVKLPEVPRKRKQ